MKDNANVKNNENNMSNILMSKTIKKTNAAFNTGGSEKSIKIEINNTSGSKKTSTMSTPVMSTPQIFDSSILNKQYKEEEEDDNFDDIDCDELESKLRKHDDVESPISLSHNNSNNLFGTFENLHSSSNLEVNNISTSYSLKSISSLSKEDSLLKKLDKKKKHNTVSGTFISPLNTDGRNNYKSKSIGLIHRNASSSSNTPVSTPVEKPFNSKIPLMLKKMRGKNVNKSTSTLDSIENLERDDIFLSTDSLIASNTYFNNMKVDSLHKGFSKYSNLDNKKRLSESGLEEMYNTKENNKGRPTSLDENKINNSLELVVDLDVSPITKPLCSEPKPVANESQNSSQLFSSNIDNTPVTVSNVIKGTIHNLNKSKKVEIYDDDDFDFGDMQEGETLKIDEKLIGSNSTSSRTSININSIVQRNYLFNNIRNNSKSKNSSSNNSKNNSNNHIEENEDEDKKLKMDEKYHGLNTKKSNSTKKLRSNTISLPSHISNTPIEKNRLSCDITSMNKKIEEYGEDDFVFDDFDNQNLKINLVPSTSRVDNNIATNILEERKKSSGNISRNSEKPPKIEIYGDDDFDFTGIDDQQLKIDEKLINPNRINSNLLDPHYMCEPKNDKGKSGDPKVHKSSNVPYNTISMDSFHNYLSNTKEIINKEVMENSYLAGIINNDYENLLSKTKLTSDDTFSFSSDSNSNLFSQNEKSDSALSKKDNKEKSSKSNSNNKESNDNTSTLPQTTPSKVKNESKKETVKTDKDEQKTSTSDVPNDEDNNGSSSIYRCDSLKTILFQKFFGIEPSEGMEKDDQHANDEVYHYLLDEITDIISNGVKSGITSESPRKTDDFRKILADINQRGINMKKIAAAKQLNHSSIMTSEAGALNEKKGNGNLKQKKRHVKKNSNRVKGSSNSVSSIRREMDFFKKNIQFDLKGNEPMIDEKKENTDTNKPVEEEVKVPSTDPPTEAQPQISSDGTLIPNTFSDIFRQRIAVTSRDEQQESSSTAHYKSPSSQLQFQKLLDKDRLVLSDAMVKHINHFKLSSQENTRSSIDSLFDSLQSQEILDKILSNNSYLMDNDNNLVGERLAAELNSDYDEETKFNLNSEPSLESLNRMNSFASLSNHYSSLSNDKVKKAFKYIDSVRKTNLGMDPMSTFNTILPSQRKKRSWRGYDKKATSKRNHLYYTIMDIINDIKKDIFFNPWHELNE